MYRLLSFISIFIYLTFLVDCKSTGLRVNIDPGDLVDLVQRRVVRQADNASTTVAQVRPPSNPPSTTTDSVVSNSNCTTVNCTNEKGTGILPEMFKNNIGMVKRTLYVLVALTAIVVLYFVVKAVRLRKNRSKSKKYGVLSQGRDNMEMTPLDQDEDDDDMTVFEVNGRRK